MTTTKQSTVGTTVYIMDPTVSPHVVLTLPALKGFSNVGGGKRGKGDASNMDSSGTNEPFGKRIDPPEATGEIVLNKANATHQKLMTLFKAQAAGTIGDLSIFVGDGDASTAPTVVAGVLTPPKSASPIKWTRSGTLGSGFISAFAPKKVDDDIDRADFSFQYSGNSTWVVKGEVISKTY